MTKYSYVKNARLKKYTIKDIFVNQDSVYNVISLQYINDSPSKFLRILP